MAKTKGSSKSFLVGKNPVLFTASSSQLQCRDISRKKGMKIDRHICLYAD
jgi:hypothetical protein